MLPPLREPPIRAKDLISLAMPGSDLRTVAILVRGPTAAMVISPGLARMMRWGLEGVGEEFVAKVSVAEKREEENAPAARVTVEARRKSRRLREKNLERIGVLG